MWRAPSLYLDKRVLATANAAGWTTEVSLTEQFIDGQWVRGDAYDWLDIPPEKVEYAIMQAVSLGNGTILTCHCNSEATAKILPDALRKIKGLGYKIVDVSSILRP
jgi:peptidoglycan/xylan/chitin deacetylase (PgdA/CDA1 family)